MNLPGRVPAAARALAPIGSLPTQNRLSLAIGLPVRDQAALDTFLQQVSDPTNANYRHYLTPAEFTQRFGPTEQDYQAVVNFAESHGLTVTATHPNRMVVDVDGTVADVQRTFHVTLRTFLHPTENRTFYAPDSDPSIDGIVPILEVNGLDNYSLPHPNSKIRPSDLSAAVSPKSGSGPSGTFLGNDFRAAYTPGVSLTGSGQSVALLEFDGYHASAITQYVNLAGLPSVPLQNVLVDGYSGAAGSGNSEVCLDIEMAISMAPGLSKVIVYEAPNSSPWVDILSRIANDNLAKQISCSWGGGPPSAAAEQIFQQMGAQGQTFFNASGDSDAFTGSIPFPSDSPNIVQVGGTTLSTLAAGGAWSSETTWNWGGGTGSSGGISTVYSIPVWQQGISMTANQGSTTKRNLPDVALTADNIYVVYGTSQTGNFGGTSCAAPLWAAFTALVNQQAAANSQPPVGFLNPAIYAIAKGANYSSSFHDITTGNNITTHSSGKFSAVAGFDLCTGWGTPKGASLIAALAGSGAGTNYTVSTSASPSNAGTTTGSGTYASGSSVTVTATANSGYSFTNWTENGTIVSTALSYTFTLTANRTLVANFSSTANNYTVSTSASPSNAGTTTGSGSYPSGSSVAVTAHANSGYSFTNWTVNGTIVSTSASYTFTLTANRTLVANFSSTGTTYTITVTASPVAGGTVSGGGTFAAGSSRSVTATHKTGYSFTKWTENGTLVTHSATYSFTLTKNRNLVAKFVHN
jgi:subtilase family serine protease